jgi:alpha-1,3-rhamnosyltransferase
MKCPPRVTFVIPSYNHEKYIKRSIVSALNQDYPNIQLIVVDDGSSDNSPSIISSLTQSNDFLYLRQRNSGLISVLNRALGLSDGKYFCWGGSDDYFQRSRVSLLVQALESNPEAAVSYGKVTYVNSSGLEGSESGDKYNKSGFIFPYLIERCFIPAPASLVKTSVLREFHGFDPRFFLEDYPLWLKIAKKYPFFYLESSVTYYRLHDNNVSANLERMVLEVERILNDWVNEPAYSIAIKQWHFRWFCDLVKAGRTQHAGRFLPNAIRYGFYYPKLWVYMAKILTSRLKP